VEVRTRNRRGGPLPGHGPTDAEGQGPRGRRDGIHGRGEAGQMNLRMQSTSIRRTNMIICNIACIRRGAKHIAVLTLLATAAACSINPVSNMPEVTLMTVEQEKKLGEEEAKKVDQEMGLLNDAALTAYV